MNKLIPAIKAYQIQEFRFFLCQKSSGSAGLRAFIADNFTPMKQAFPQLPLLVRESTGHEAMVIARFPMGKEVAAKVEGQTEADIQKSLVEIMYSHHKAIGAPPAQFTKITGEAVPQTLKAVDTAVATAAV